MSLGINAKIQTDIQTLQAANGRLERLSAKIGTVGDTDELRTQMERTRDSAKHLCSQLLQTLQNAEQTPMISRLTKDFGTELKRFEAVSMEIKSRDTKVVEAYSQNTKSGGYFEADLNSDWGAGAVSRHQQQAQQQQQKQMERDVLIPFAVEDMKRRQEEIHAIERDVVDIHEMVRDLNTMVTQQGEQLETIDGVLRSAQTKTEQAYDELRGAEDYQKKARKRKCCIIVILLIVITAVVLGVWQLAK